MSRVCLCSIALLLLLSACNNANKWEPIEIGGPTMGTQWSVLIASEIEPANKKQLEQAITKELKRINKLMSTYDPSSQLSQFNQSASLNETTLHPDTLAVLDAAIQISKLTGGAYDVTLQPLISLWGFSQRAVGDVLPTDTDINNALANTGYSNIVRASNSVTRLIPGVQIDLSSIAKGFAVDQIGGLVEAAGVENYSAEIGGEIRTRGVNAAGEPWKIGLEMPTTEVVEGIAVNDAHIASSGSYRHYRELNGVRYSHLIDGRTGKPIQHKLAAVTVLHESTMLADAWATALMVLGEERGQQVAIEQGLSVQLTVKTGERFELIRLGGFEKQLLAPKQ